MIFVFTVGFELLHAITSTSLQEFRLDLDRWNGITGWAEFLICNLYVESILQNRCELVGLIFFIVGLGNLHAITSMSLQELQLDLDRWNGNTELAEFQFCSLRCFFKIDVYWLQ